jgi:hypothetical protein
MAQNPSANKYEWVADVTGELRGADLVAQIGGGTFRFFGHITTPDGKAKRIAYNRKVTLAGPRKNFAFEPPPPQIVAPAAQPQNDGLIRLLEKINDRLDRLERTPAPAPTSLKDMAETMVLLKSLNPEAPPAANADREVVHAYVEMLKQGIALGQVREPIAEDGGTDWGKVIESAVPLVDRILTRRPPPRPQGRPVNGAPPQPPPAQTAEPTPAPTAEEDPAQAAERARWLVLIDSLSRAITRREAVEDFADRVESILTEDEVTLLRLSSPEQVIGELKTYAADRYPVLATPGAKDYVAQVLAELNAAPSDDSEPPAA